MEVIIIQRGIIAGNSINIGADIAVISPYGYVPWIQKNIVIGVLLLPRTLILIPIL